MLKWLNNSIILFLLASAVLLAGCKGNADAFNGKSVKLVLGAYTTPREAYGKAIIPAFQQYWKEKTGQEVEFQESYQASGAQARAIARALKQILRRFRWKVI